MKRFFPAGRRRSNTPRARITPFLTAVLLLVAAQGFAQPITLLTTDTPPLVFSLSRIFMAGMPTSADLYQIPYAGAVYGEYDSLYYYMMTPQMIRREFTSADLPFDLSMTMFAAHPWTNSYLWIDSTGILHADTLYENSFYHSFSRAFENGWGYNVFVAGNNEGDDPGTSLLWFTAGLLSEWTTVLSTTLPVASQHAEFYQQEGWDDLFIWVVLKTETDGQEEARLFRVTHGANDEVVDYGARPLAASHGVLNDMDRDGVPDALAAFSRNPQDSSRWLTAWPILEDTLGAADYLHPIPDGAEVSLLASSEGYLDGTGVAWQQVEGDTHQLVWLDLGTGEWNTQETDEILALRMTGYWESVMDTSFLTSFLVFTERDPGTGRLSLKSLINHLELNGVPSSPAPLPSEPVLVSAYPNPFNDVTSLTITLARALPVEVAVYDLSGRRVFALPRQSMLPGVHRVPLSFAVHATGVYFVRVRTPLRTVTTRLIHLK